MLITIVIVALLLYVTYNRFKFNRNLYLYLGVVFVAGVLAVPLVINQVGTLFQA